MANTHSTLTSLFTAIANAIREKTGGTEAIKADQFPAAISAIPSGGANPDNIFAVQNNLRDGYIQVFPFVTGMTWAEYLYGSYATMISDSQGNIRYMFEFSDNMGRIIFYFPGDFGDISHANLCSTSGHVHLNDAVHGYDEEIYFLD